MKKFLFIFISAIIGIGIISYILTLTHTLPVSGKVGLVRIEGVILESEDVIEELKTFSKDSSIKAIVLRINSPGGAVTPSQEIYDEIIKLRKDKKVIASLGTVAASGGYYIASSADKIVANPGTLTGSIGVIMEIPNFEGLMKKIGVERRVIKSGKHKDMSSVFKSMTEEEREILQSVLDDVHEQFIKAVSDGRGIEYKKVKDLADGRIFTGKKAKEIGLIDVLGNLEDAVRLAGQLGGIKGEPQIVTKKKKFSVWDLISGYFPHEIAKEGFSGIRLKYILVP